MKRLLALVSVLSASALFAACNFSMPGGKPSGAKGEMQGEIVFSQGQFDDAKGYKSFDEFKKSMNVLSELVVKAPETSLRYYGVFKEPLNGDEYVVQVFDLTDGSVAHTDRRDGMKPGTTQVTAGWTFAVEQWPVPADAKNVESNDVWIKPGHQYQVVILKPLAKGTFSVADVPTPPPTPTPVAKGGGKKKGK